MNQKYPVNDDLFHPVEHAILCDWLCVERPAVAAGLDLEAHLDGPDDGPVTLKRTSDGDTNEFTLANAVARLVLEAIQHRLPNTAICYTGKIVLTRDYNPKARRKLDLLPRLLFTINWANSAPGISWPAAYYLAWLPVYDCYIVTESADSPDAYGYCDRALGWFDAGTPLEEGARRVIAGNWKDQHEQWDQQQWENFWDAGLVSWETAESWAEEVWGNEDDEEAGDEEEGEDEACV